MSRPIVAEILPDALRANLARVRQSAPGARVWAVVKAHAYGHGLDAALQGLSASDGLALVEFDAAARLRALGCTAPILMLEGAFDREDLEQAAAQNLQLVVHSPEQLGWLETQAAGLSVGRGISSGAGPVGPKALSVCIKVDTGMHRLGFDPQVVPDAVNRVARLRARGIVGDVGLMTHFANADQPGGAQAALQCWAALHGALPACATWPRSLSNSAAIIDRVAPAGDWVRPGIMLYGASPFADRTARDLALIPAMRLKSELIAIRTIAPGEAVGYGSQFVAPAQMRIGVVACGYADGYPRHAPTGTPIAVAGSRTRIVGRVSMDMITVDLEGLPQAQVGSAVELWGEAVSVDDVAQAAGTIGYELLCAVAPRVPRRLI